MDEVENKIPVESPACETDQQCVARTMMRPSVQAAVSMKSLGLYETKEQPGELPALIDELSNQIKSASEGDAGRMEATLLAQATTLDGIFHATLRRSLANMGAFPDAAERYMKLALKAQSQCRTTVLALSEMRNPKASQIVAQQNIAHGPQQVVNHLERYCEERLDGGETQAPGGDDLSLETVGVIDRAADL